MSADAMDLQHESRKNLIAELRALRIAVKACVSCGRSLAHRTDYTEGQECQRCDTDDEPMIGLWDEKNVSLDDLRGMIWQQQQANLELAGAR